MKRIIFNELPEEVILFDDLNYDRNFVILELSNEEDYTSKYYMVIEDGTLVSICGSYFYDRKFSALVAKDIINSWVTDDKEEYICKLIELLKEEDIE